MAFPILGTPKPAFFDSSGNPLVSGTITIQNPSDSAVKASYPTAADADAGTNGTSGDITLDSRGEPTSTQLWGKNNEDYKIIIKDSSGSTIYTLDNIQMPTHNRRAAVTFTSGDATPTIAESNVFITDGSTAITDFDDGQVGDVIHITSSASITVKDGGAINLMGSEDYTMDTDDTLTLTMFTDQVWTETGRSRVFPNTIKFKTADSALTSSTLADDTHLVNYVLGPAQYYAVEGYLSVVADAGARDLEIDVTTSNAFQNETYSWISVDAGNALAVDQGETQALTSAVANIDIDGTSQVGIIIRGYVLTHATLDSNVDMQFANQAGAGTVTVQKGSWVSFRPMGFQ